jgi:hypothetical protein
LHGRAALRGDGRKLERHLLLEAPHVGFVARLPRSDLAHQSASGGAARGAEERFEASGEELERHLSLEAPELLRREASVARSAPLYDAERLFTPGRAEPDADGAPPRGSPRTPAHPATKRRLQSGEPEVW